jgi:mono/diheme cytochrome c family protein
MEPTDGRPAPGNVPDDARDVRRPVGDGGVPEAGGVDLQPDVERIHRTIRREPRDPVEGREPVPWFFTAAVALSLFWGGWYLGRYGGEFGTTTHMAFASRQSGIAEAAAGQTAGAVSDPILAGKAVYEKNCQVCHQATGRGVPGAFPPVVGSEWVTGSPHRLLRILLHGLQGPVQVAGATYNGAMPAWNGVLGDEEIAAVATYIRQLDSNDAPAIPVTDVARVRDATPRTSPWTAAELNAVSDAPGASEGAAGGADSAASPATRSGPS